MTKPPPRNAVHKCPECGEYAIVRSSEAVTNIYRELRYHCRDPECGAVFIVEMSVRRFTRRGTRPNPAVNLPVSPFTLEARAAAAGPPTRRTA